MLASNGWLAVANSGHCTIFHRRQRNAAPVFARGARELLDARESRLRTDVTIRGKQGPALIVFRRPWLPGWRATLDGEPLHVVRADEIMPAVEIPDGAEGKLVLVYRPMSLVIGAAIAGLSLLTGIVFAVVRGRRIALGW